MARWALLAAFLAFGQSGPALKIVVIDGEGAVNIIQQKTAVAPVIEVRDRNDQPVAGATVNFVVRAGRATFGGARTLTVTTNAAGRAAAAGLAPSGTGALQIGATATFQGQTAAAITIAQTNVLTAAEAAAASSAAASGSSGTAGAASGTSGAAGAGGGAGMSLTTIGIVGGAAAAAGAVVATKSGGEDATTFVGQLSAVMPETEVAIPLEVNYSCERTQNQSGTIKIVFDTVDAPVHGTMSVEIHAHVSPGNCNLAAFEIDLYPAEGVVSGARDSVTGTIRNQNTFTSTGSVAGTGTVTEAYVFNGRFDGENQITGSLTLDRTVNFRGPLYSSDSRGMVTYQVTLRKQ